MHLHEYQAKQLFADFGIPVPDGRVITGPGCKVFNERTLPEERLRLNRTPFYFELAALENDFKFKTGLAGRMKMTVAEIICSFGNTIS